MSDNRIALAVYFTALGGREDEAATKLAGLAKQSRRDKGCLRYDMHRSPENPCEFFLYELWNNQEDLDDHLTMPHLVEFMAKAEIFLSGPARVVNWKQL